MLAHIFIGLFIAVIGYLMVWKTNLCLDIFGSVPWAEKNLGGGGSRLFYKLLGLLIILLGFLIITDLYDVFMTSFFASLFG